MDMHRQALISNLSHDLIKYAKNWEEKDIPRLVHLVCELVETHHMNYAKKELSKEVLVVVIRSLENLQDRELLVRLALDIVDRYVSITLGETTLNKVRRESCWKRCFCCCFRPKTEEKVKCAELLAKPALNVPA